VRRAPAAPAAADVQAPAPSDAAMLGTLPIVTDQFATVTVVPNEELRRSTSDTLGDLLFSKPGITGSSFTPGASSRPVVRGLDVNPVGIVENGVGGGVSDLGEDHFVPINPLATQQIEVIRGPATLRYGSQSIGGVVSATNDRIPDALPCRANIAGAPNWVQGACLAFETRGAARTVGNGLEGGVLLDARDGNFAIHADAFGRKADDYRVASYPYLFAPGRPFDGSNPTRRCAPTSSQSAARMSSIKASSAPRSPTTTRSITSRALTARTTIPTRARSRSPARANIAREARVPASLDPLIVQVALRDVDRPIQA
jgi:iron complex outermembrane receptor protein